MGDNQSNPPNPKAPDPRLVRAAQRGDREALRTLLEPETNRLFATCLRMLGPNRREDAQDLAHDSIIKIIRGLPAFDHRSSFTTWSTRVAMNACLSKLRAERRRRDASAREIPSDPALMDGASGGSAPSSPRRADQKTPISDSDRTPNREPEPTAGVESDEQRRLLLEGLTHLSPEHRAVLVLRDIRDLDYEAIGAVLGIGVGTVKSRLFRARAGLRRWVEDQTRDRTQTADQQADTDTPEHDDSP